MQQKSQHYSVFIIYSFFGVLGMTLVLCATSKYGVGLSPDSVDYISTARNLIDGKGFYKFTNEPFVQWPPLYPLLLATIGLFGINPLYGARFLNIAAFGLTIFFFICLILRIVKTKPLILWAALACLFSVPLLKVAVMAWSEPIYILLSILFFLVFCSYLKKQEKQVLLLCSSVAALICLQRYVGIILVATGALSILFFTQNSSVSRRIRDSLIFICTALSPVLVWLSYNFFSTGTLAGRRAPAYWGTSKHLSDLVTVINNWFLPYSFPLPLYYLLLVMLMAFIIFIHVWHQRRSRLIKAKCDFTLKPIIIYILLYAVFIVLSSSYMANEPIGNRLLSPIYPFLIIIFCVCLKQLNEFINTKTGRRGFLKFIFLCVFFLWLLYPVYGAINFIKICRQEGAGEDFYGQSYYGKDAWQESPLIKWVRCNKLEGKIYSNEPYALYILTGFVASYSPMTTVPISRVAAELPHHKNCLIVWFKESFDSKTRFFMGADQLYSLKQLHSLFKIEEVAVFDDGYVFRINTQH